jgi:hypothetical protein
MIDLYQRFGGIYYLHVQGSAEFGEYEVRREVASNVAAMTYTRDRVDTYQTTRFHNQ